jgi:transposase
MLAKYVRPYSKGQKNDFNDAEAIAEAVQRPTMKFVATKTADQLDLQALHRVRERLVSQRMSIGRIMRASGAPTGRPQWSWSCHLHGRPQGSDERGTAAETSMTPRRSFGRHWSGIRAGLAEADIAAVHRIAEISEEALARYDRRN